MRAALVTAADAGFIAYLADLVDSARAVGLPAGTDLCVIDLGLTALQREQLSPKVDRFAEGAWDFAFPGQQSSPRHLQALTVRPFLQKYFPDYDCYYWVDADIWFQTGRGIEQFLLASGSADVAISPEIHRAYGSTYHLGDPQEEFFYGYWVAIYGTEVARRMIDFPPVNCGQFAIRRGSPAWPAYADALRDAFHRHINVLTEQLAFNKALRSGAFSAAYLEVSCNWCCSLALPMFDPSGRMLLDPELPHEPIDTVHLTSCKHLPQPVPLVNGGTRSMPLDYQTVRLRTQSAPQTQAPLSTGGWPEVSW